MSRPSGRRIGRWAAATISAGLFAGLGSCGPDPVSKPPMRQSGGGGDSAQGGSSSAEGGTSEPTGGTSSGGVSSGGMSSGGASSGGNATSGGVAPSAGSTAEGGAPMADAGAGGVPTTEAGSGGAATGGSMAATGGDSGTAGAEAMAGAGGAPGPTNRDEFFGESRCTAEFLLCEDFENAALDESRWTVEGAGVPTIETTRAARGARSAHFHTEDNEFVLIRETETFPAQNNTYYARAFFYFDSMPTAPMDAHWGIVGAVGTGTDSEIRVGGQFNGEQNVFGVGSDRGETGDWTRHDDDPAGSPLPVPVDDWVCIEWLHKGDTNETRFYWDEVEHPSLYTSATDHGGTQSADYLLPTFESVWFGWWHYQGGTVPPQFDVWIDEIVVDDEPIGCVR